MIYNCKNHYGTEGKNKCSVCYEHFCNQCISIKSKKPICLQCKKEKLNSRIIFTTISIIVFFIFIILFSSTFRNYCSSVIASVSLDSKSCDGQKIYDIVNLNRSLNKNQKALEYTKYYLKNCEEDFDIRRQQLNIHKDLKDYASALKDMDALLESDPYDKDFWVWKAQIYESMKDYDLAIQNYRESIKLSPSLISIPMNLIDLYRKTKRYCEGYQELERYAVQYPEIRSDNKIQYMFNQLEELGKCEKNYSKGETIIKFAPGSSTISTLVKFNDTVEGVFIIDTGASEVSLTKSFSKKIKTIGESKPTFFMTANGITKGLITSVEKISLKGISSNNVPININETDIPGVDGLLGMSFLSRFQIELDSSKGILRLKQKTFKPKP